MRDIEQVAETLEENKSRVLLKRPFPGVEIMKERDRTYIQ